MMPRWTLAGALLAAIAIPATVVASQLPEGWSHPTVAYDGVQVMRTGEGFSGEMPVYYMPPGKYRQEMSHEDGMSVAIIIRQDLELAWTLLPGGMYMEIPIDEMEQDSPSTEGIVEYKVVGREEVNGWPTTRYHVLMMEDGEQTEGDFWITEHWIPVRMEIRMDDDPGEVMVMEMRELNIRAQDAALFELPPDARKFEGMQGLGDLMGGGQGGFDFPAELLQEATETARETTKEESKREVRDAVRDGVRGLFRR